MEKMASDSIAIEAECEDFVINIPPDLPHEEWQEYCIYKVPKHLRQVNEAAYTPKLVSIGPFHHGNDDLKYMEKHKLKYLDDFMKHTKKSRADLLKIIKVNEVKIRHCYSEDCTLKSDDFVKMILSDAIFIIELFWKAKNNKNDYILSKPWLTNGIIHDLILLENQLPFFVLEKLYMFATNDYSSSCNHHEEGKQIEQHKEDLKRQDAPFVQLSRIFFSCYDQDMKKHDSIRKEVTQKPIGMKVKHFTDLVRYMFFSIPDLENAGLKDENFEGTRYCATKLDNAGLKFKAAKKGPLLEIKLHQNLIRCCDCSCLLSCLPCLKCFPCLERMQSILEVPPLEIHDYTEALFRNLMALEQCHYSYDTYICNYIVLLDCLINTEEDLDLLIDKKVIVNQLGSNTAVVKMINKLGNQITVSASCYSEVAKKLNDHYEYPLNKLLATLTSVYFRDFWRGTASIVGLVVLGFTFVNFLRPYVKWL